MGASNEISDENIKSYYSIVNELKTISNFTEITFVLSLLTTVIGGVTMLGAIELRRDLKEGLRSEEFILVLLSGLAVIAFGIFLMYKYQMNSNLILKEKIKGVTDLHKTKMENA
jgi:hypothetical protein